MRQWTACRNREWRRLVEPCEVRRVARIGRRGMRNTNGIRSSRHYLLKSTEKSIEPLHHTCTFQLNHQSPSSFLPLNQRNSPEIGPQTLSTTLHHVITNNSNGLAYGATLRLERQCSFGSCAPQHQVLLQSQQLCSPRAVLRPLLHQGTGSVATLC